MAKKSKITLKNQRSFVKKMEKMMNDTTKEVNKRYLYQHTYKVANMAAKSIYSDLLDWYNEYEPKKYTRAEDGKNLLSSVTIVKYKTIKKYNYRFGVKLDYTQMSKRVIKNSFNQHLSFKREDFRLGLIDIITNPNYGSIPGILGNYHNQTDVFKSARRVVNSEINDVEIIKIATEGYKRHLQQYGIKIKTKR